jgi:hypothetical protein
MHATNMKGGESPYINEEKPRIIAKCRVVTEEKRRERRVGFHEGNR